jgi:hypothetical protein
LSNIFKETKPKGRKCHFFKLLSSDGCGWCFDVSEASNWNILALLRLFKKLPALFSLLVLQHAIILKYINTSIHPDLFLQLLL